MHLYVCSTSFFMPLLFMVYGEYRDYFFNKLWNKTDKPIHICRNWKQMFAEFCRNVFSSHYLIIALHTPISLQQYVITLCSYLWFSCLYDLTYLRCLYINMHNMSLIIQSKLINEKIKKYLQYMITRGRHNNFLHLVFLRLQLLCIGVFLVTPYNV